MKKVCSKCGVEKDYEEFALNTNGRGIGGRRANCKSCDTLRVKERRDRIRGVEREVKTEKKCYTCKKIKPISYFGKANHLKSGVHSNCKECENRRARENRAKRKAKDPESYRKKNKENNLKHFYGISIEEYNSMIERCNSSCECCGKKLVKNRDGNTGSTMNVAMIDHCHRTGIIRGILCSQCNTALGLLQDDLSIINSLYNYAEKWVDKT